MSLSRSRELKLVAIETARILRKTQTPAERVLWGSLRNRGLEGKKFLRQHPILLESDGKATFFVVDFFCAEEDLVIEVDGGIHLGQVEHDRAREDALNALGYRVLRVRNKEIEDDLAKALEKIIAAMNRTHPLTPPLFPSKERGTGGELTSITSHRFPKIHPPPACESQ